MAASFPTTKKTFSTLTDAVDTILAAHQNERGDEITAIEGNLLEGMEFPLRFAAASEVTIAAGVITVTKGVHTVDTEADAASDDLATITASGHHGAESFLLLRAANVARVVTLKDGTGNLLLNGDYDLDATDKQILLVYDGTNWREVARSARELAVDDLPTSGEWPAENLDVSAGNGSEKFKLAGLIDFDDTQDGNSAGSEEVLRTYTIPANSFDANGRTLKATFVGTLAADTDSKRLRVRLGGLAGTEIANCEQNSASLLRFMVQVWITRLGAASQRVVGRIDFFVAGGTGAGTSSTLTVTTTTADETGAIDLTLTVDAVDTNDAVYEASWVEWLN